MTEVIKTTALADVVATLAAARSRAAGLQGTLDFQRGAFAAEHADLVATLAVAKDAVALLIDFGNFRPVFLPTQIA